MTPKTKKVIKVVLGIVAVAAAIGGTWAAIHYWTRKKGNGNSSDTPTTAVEPGDSKPNPNQAPPRYVNKSSADGFDNCAGCGGLCNNYGKSVNNYQNCCGS